MQSSKILEIIIDLLSETVPAMLNIIHKVIIVSNLKIRRSSKKLQKLSLEEKNTKYFLHTDTACLDKWGVGLAGGWAGGVVHKTNYIILHTKKIKPPDLTY